MNTLTLAANCKGTDIKFAIPQAFMSLLSKYMIGLHLYHLIKKQTQF